MQLRFMLWVSLKATVKELRGYDTRNEERSRGHQEEANCPSLSVTLSSLEENYTF